MREFCIAAEKQNRAAQPRRAILSRRAQNALQIANSRDGRTYDRQREF
jgi:hypothetical protein